METNAKTKLEGIKKDLEILLQKNIKAVEDVRQSIKEVDIEIEKLSEK